MKVLDSHHHFWNYDPVEYGWIGREMGLLQRDFGTGDLGAVMDAAGVDAAISVQARQNLEETEWLLGIAAESERIAGVVGWVPLAEDGIHDHLDRLSDEPKLVGVRHVVQDEPDDGFILGDTFNRGVAALAGRGLVYEILIFQRHLPQATRFVDRHPNQVFVLDHLAKPVVDGAPEDAWKRGISELAKRENVSCKLSGLVTEVRADRWGEELLRPYIDHVFDAFGSGRILVGSDWPVCLLRINYRRWFEVIRRFLSDLSDTERAGVMGANATRVYGVA